MERKDSKCGTPSGMRICVTAAMFFRARKNGGGRLSGGIRRGGDPAESPARIACRADVIRLSVAEQGVPEAA